MGSKSSGFVMQRELVIKVGNGKHYRKLNKGEKTSETMEDNKSLTRKFGASKLPVGLPGTALMRRVRDSYISLMRTASNLSITGHGDNQSGIAAMQKEYVEYLKIAMAKGGPDFLLKLQG